MENYTKNYKVYDYWDMIKDDLTCKFTKRIHDGPKSPKGSHSSVCSELPDTTVHEDIQLMILLDDVLMMKGHPKSVSLKDEKPYSEMERSVMIHQLMNLRGVKKDRVSHIYRKSLRKGTEDRTQSRYFINVLKKTKKDEYILGKNTTLDPVNQYLEFIKKLMQVAKVASLEPKVLFKGKAKLLCHHNITDMSVKRIVAYKYDTFINNCSFKEYDCLGNISDNAKKELLKRSWNSNVVFEVKEEFIIEHRQCGKIMEWDHIKTNKKRLLIKIDNCWM